LAEAVDLAVEFAGLIRARQPERLGPWLARARDGRLPAFRGFAKRLSADEAAVRAAAMHPWSTGQVEGQINRLKTIRRQDVRPRQARPARSTFSARRMITESGQEPTICAEPLSSAETMTWAMIPAAPHLRRCPQVR
jgi:hypothetical protein